MNAVVLSFDCLPCRFLGAYGNLWVRTPNFDRLAAEATVFHQHHAAWLGESPSDRCWWCEPAAPTASVPSRQALAETDRRALQSLRTAGVRTLWRGEARDRKNLPADRLFESRAVFLGEDRTEGTPDETPWFQMAVDSARLLPRLFRTVRSPWLLWLQSAGVPTPWTAPRDWALRYLDLEEDDPRGATAAMLRLSDPGRSADWSAPDWKFSRGLCAGYVAMLDAILGGVLEAIDAASVSQAPLLIVLGGRGIVLSPRADFPGSLRSVLTEATQTPLFVRLPGQKMGSRRQELVQPIDLIPTLQEWFQATTSDPPYRGRSLLPLTGSTSPDWRDHTLTVSTRGGYAYRSTSQLLLQETGVHSGESALSPRLYRKPEDHWEILDVGPSSPEALQEISEDAATRLRLA